MSNQETIFADVFIPLLDDPISRVLNSFLFDDEEEFDDKLFWEEIKKRLTESNSQENQKIIDQIEESTNENDLFIGGAKPSKEGDYQYINLLLFARHNDERGSTHYGFLKTSFVETFNRLTGRSKGNYGVFIHMADTTHRCFVVTDGVIPVYMDVVKKQFD